MTMTKTVRKQGLDLARVLIADDHPASRLTLQTVLRPEDIKWTPPLPPQKL